MKRFSYSTLVFAAVLVLGMFASGLAVALDGRDCIPPVHTPSPNGAVLATRVFNDAVTHYNAAITQFPASVLAWAFGFKTAQGLE